jgi:hypothetical protein
MSAAERTGTAANSWVPSAGRLGASMRARKIARAQRDERAKSARVAIVCSLFLVLLAAALLVGGHTVIDPLLQSAAAAREAKRVGDIVYTMPDGTFCRHLSFDNGTAELMEGAIEQCPNDVLKKRVRTVNGFAWGGR